MCMCSSTCRPVWFECVYANVQNQFARKVGVSLRLEEMQVRHRLNELDWTAGACGITYNFVYVVKDYK